MLTDGVLRCDMKPDCIAPVTHIDSKGFIYCAPHGVQRKAGGYQCRKLTASEVKTLTRGEAIAYSKPKGPSPKSIAKAAEALTERACYKALAGKQINILGIPKLHRNVYDVAVKGGSEADVQAAADRRVGIIVGGEAADVEAAKREPALAAVRAAYYTEPVFPLRYRTHTIERDGTEWTSSEAFEAPEPQWLRDTCIAEHDMGTIFWITEEGTGRFLNGIGRNGHWITCSHPSRYPSYISGRLTPVYFPAVRIYNPHPRLTYRRIRGSAHTLVAYDTRDASLGPEPVGWVLGEDVPAGVVVS